jgi:hypothetical protein
MQPHPLSVFDEDSPLPGDSRPEQVAQPPGYLRASRIGHGLPVNFGSPRRQIRQPALSEG